MSERLSTEISGVQTMGVRRSLGWPEVTRFLDPGKLATILSAAREGKADEYLTLAEEMEERDLHYRSVLSTRKQAVEGLTPTVKPAGEDEKDLELAAAVESHILLRDDLTETIKNALDALGKGYSVHEIIWETSKSPWRPGEIIWRDPRWFAYDRENAKKLMLKTSGDALQDLAENKYIIHAPHLKSGLPIRGGLALPAAFFFLVKYYDVTSWAAFIDRFGFPIRIGKYDKRASEDDVETLKNAIAHIGEDVGATIPESMKLEIIESKTTGNVMAYEKMADWVDRQISKLVLGQTMTADSGSSRAQAEVHDDVRQDILEADARQLEKTLNRDLVRPFIDLNFGVQERYPVLVIPTPDTTDITALVENLEKMVPLGLKVKVDEVRAKMGLTRPEEGDDVLQPAQAASPVAALNRALNAAGSGGPGDDEADEIARGAEYAPISEDILKAVNSLAGKCRSLQEFASRLPELLALWDMEKAAGYLTSATWKARAAGDSHFGR